MKALKVHPAFRAEINRNALIWPGVARVVPGFTKVWASGSEASFSRGVMTSRWGELSLLGLGKALA